MPSEPQRRHHVRAACVCAAHVDTVATGKALQARPCGDNPRGPMEPQAQATPRAPLGPPTQAQTAPRAVRPLEPHALVSKSPRHLAPGAFPSGARADQPHPTHTHTLWQQGQHAWPRAEGNVGCLDAWHGRDATIDVMTSEHTGLNRAQGNANYASVGLTTTTT